MRQIYTLLLALATLLTTTYAHAQSKDSTVISYKPQIFGAVKAKMEVSMYDGQYRFNVRNSRIGVKGFASSHMRYAIQIDFNNEGKLAILDSYAAFSYKRFELVLGQQQYKFSADLDRGPNTNIFANRSFLSKFLTSYYGSEVAGGKESRFVKTIGSRDIGALAVYKTSSLLPIKLSLGAFNGAGTNNPEWSNNINIVARIDIGNTQGLSGAISHYNGRTPLLTRYTAPSNPGEAPKNEAFHQELRMWGCALQYNKEALHLETEYAQRRLSDEQLHVMHTAFVQGYYSFSLPKSSIANYICPLARWDMGNDVEFINAATKTIDRFSAHRATIGVNFGFATKLISSELRLNFEKYMFNDRPSDLPINKLLQDKFTIEIVASF